MNYEVARSVFGLHEEEPTISLLGAEEWNDAVLLSS
jgi:hypothetical protein